MSQEETKLVLNLLKEYTEKLDRINKNLDHCPFWQFSYRKYLKECQRIYSLKLKRLIDYAKDKNGQEQSYIKNYNGI